MSEVETQLIPYCIEYICDKCGIGKMQVMSITLLVNPPIYPHQCDECGARQEFKESYPTIRYKDA